MKEKLWNALILLLGVMASFAFYGFWQTESTPLVDNPQNTTAVTLDSTTHSDVTPKYIELPLALSKLPIEEFSKDAEPLDIPYDTPEAMEIHTQEVYDALQPENHDVTIEKANEAFSVMDEQVRHVEEQLKEHMKISAPKQNHIEENTIEDDEPYEMELPIINE